MISRAGVLSSFHKPSSKLSLRAAKSNRALCASQGLISWSKVSTGLLVDISFSNSDSRPSVKEFPQELLLTSLTEQGLSRGSGADSSVAADQATIGPMLASLFRAGPNPVEFRLPTVVSQAHWYQPDISSRPGCGSFSHGPGWEFPLRKYNRAHWRREESSTIVETIEERRQLLVNSKHLHWSL